MPPASGRIAWVRSLQQRIDCPMDILKGRQCVIEHRSAQLSVKYYNYLSELFLHTEMQLHKGWYDYVDEVRARLANRVLRKNLRTNWLEVNFHPSIYRLIRESECMLRMQLDIPQLAEVMVFCKEKAMESYETMRQLVDENNRLRMSMDMCMLNISRPLLRQLEVAFKPGLSTVSWTSDHLDDYFESVRLVLADVGVFIQQTNDIKAERIENVFESILELDLICIPSDPISADEFLQVNVEHRQEVGEFSEKLSSIVCPDQNIPHFDRENHRTEVAVRRKCHRRTDQQVRRSLRHQGAKSKGNTPFPVATRSANGGESPN